LPYKLSSHGSKYKRSAFAAAHQQSPPLLRNGGAMLNMFDSQRG
jgi:hypothetical protein